MYMPQWTKPASTTTATSLVPASVPLNYLLPGMTKTSTHDLTKSIARLIPSRVKSSAITESGKHTGT